MNTTSNGPGGPTRDTRSQSGAGSGGDELKENARHLADEAREEGKARANQARDAAADNIDKLAEGARAAASELEDDDAGQLSEYVSEAAERMSELSGSLREKSVDELMGDLTRFARDQPAMFLSGSVAIGFGLARFARASGSRKGTRRFNAGGSPVEGRSSGSRPPGAEASSAGSSAGSVTPSSDRYPGAGRSPPGVGVPPGAGASPGTTSHKPGGFR